MALREDPVSPPAEAYPREHREAHARQHVTIAAAANFLDRTSCWQICRSYGIPHFIDELKALRAKFRNELSFTEGK